MRIISVNVRRAAFQASQLAAYGEDIRQVRGRLLQYQESLNVMWQAPEMQHINAAIQELAQEISGVLREMEELQRDIVQAAEEAADEEDDS